MKLSIFKVLEYSSYECVMVYLLLVIVFLTFCFRNEDKTLYLISLFFHTFDLLFGISLCLLTLVGRIYRLWWMKIIYYKCKTHMRSFKKVMTTPIFRKTITATENHAKAVIHWNPFIWWFVTRHFKGGFQKCCIPTKMYRSTNPDVDI